MAKKERIVTTAISLFRDGKNNEGVELLYRQYYVKMYSIAFSILKNESDSRDAVHNVIVKLLSIKTENCPKTNEEGWLYSVIKNEALDLLKKNSALLPLDESFVSSDEFEANEIKAIVDMDSYQNMISRLDSERQEVVTLKVLGGFTHKEIAEIMGKPIGTVQWLYATAITRLRKSIFALIITAIVSSSEAIRWLLINSDGSTDIPEDIPNTGGSPTYVLPIPLIVFGIIAIVCIAILVYIYVRGPVARKKHKNK